MVVPPPHAAMTDKRFLRARLRAARDAFVAERGGAIAAPSLFLDALRPGVVVASYVPIGSEADPAAFDTAVRTMGATLVLPVVIDRASPIRFAIADPVALVAGPFGLRQPPAGAASVTPDIILTPLVGFDRAGNRLGQGAGHYDRAFVAYPDALRIGIAWAVQQVEALPADPWDVPLHAIATEGGVQMFGDCK